MGQEITNEDNTLHNITIDEHGDAFDWAYAIWYWLSHNHEGQDSEKYAALSMSSNYNMSNIPDIDFDSECNCDCSCENCNAKMYYHEITEENWQDIYAQFCEYMDNDWEDDNG